MHYLATDIFSINTTEAELYTKSLSLGFRWHISTICVLNGTIMRLVAVARPALTIQCVCCKLPASYSSIVSLKIKPT
jgi:hypothetical protein